MSKNGTMEERFIIDALKRVEYAESYVVELEKDPANKTVICHLSKVFQPLLGIARFLDLTEIYYTARSIKRLIDNVIRDGVYLFPECEIRRISIYIECLKEFIFQIKDPVTLVAR